MEMNGLQDCGDGLPEVNSCVKENGGSLTRPGRLSVDDDRKRSQNSGAFVQPTAVSAYESLIHSYRRPT